MNEEEVEASRYLIKLWKLTTGVLVDSASGISPLQRTTMMAEIVKRVEDLIQNGAYFEYNELLSEAEEGTEVYDRIASKKMLFGLAASLNHTLKEGSESDEVEVFLFELMDNHPRIYNQLATIAKSIEPPKIKISLG